jgi:hypothetical protein
MMIWRSVCAKDSRNDANQKMDGRKEKRFAGGHVQQRRGRAWPRTRGHRCGQSPHHCRLQGRQREPHRIRVDQTVNADSLSARAAKKWAVVSRIFSSDYRVLCQNNRAEGTLRNAH